MEAETEILQGKLVEKSYLVTLIGKQFQKNGSSVVSENKYICLKVGLSGLIKSVCLM